LIKSLIILVLVVVLSAGAFVSRPKPAEFKPFIKQQIEQNAKSFGGRLLADFQVDRYVDISTINDRLLWVSVQREGKTVYTGAFNHWWGNDPALKK
jgi:hypothetical protein